MQRILKCPRASLESLSEAAHVFDPNLLVGIIGELVHQLPIIQKNTPFDEIKGILTLVDGSLLPALPKLVGAMWLDDEHKAFKLHVHFELLKSVPVRADLTDGNRWVQNGTFYFSFCFSRFRLPFSGPSARAERGLDAQTGGGTESETSAMIWDRRRPRSWPVGGVDPTELPWEP